MHLLLLCEKKFVNRCALLIFVRQGCFQNWEHSTSSFTHDDACDVGHPHSFHVTTITMVTKVAWGFLTQSLPYA
jgi:hypothetical protein